MVALPAGARMHALNRPIDSGQVTNPAVQVPGMIRWRSEQGGRRYRPVEFRRLSRQPERARPGLTDERSAPFATMNPPQEQLAFARTLRTEILEADAVWLPRREDLLTWLSGFIGRAQAADYELGKTEVADLAALDRFLRRRHVPQSRPLGDPQPSGHSADFAERLP